MYLNLRSFVVSKRKRSTRVLNSLLLVTALIYCVFFISSISFGLLFSLPSGHVQQFATPPLGSPTSVHSESSGLPSMSFLGGLALGGGLLAQKAKKRKNVNKQTSPVIHVGDINPDIKIYSTLVSSGTTRRKTRTVNVGKVPVGSSHPIATQTMTTSSTDNVSATVDQVERCTKAGIDIVRVTTQGIKEAKACGKIQSELGQRNITTPLVADIHFKPKVALAVADHVNKVRINPGNFIDGVKTFDKIGSDTVIGGDLLGQWHNKIREKLTPLVDKMKKLNKPIRIGVNHGSLAERILLQYGDSPAGMVASAIEFGEVCRENNFHDLIFSMKSSNPRVMVQAYRLLAAEMHKRGWDYPLHLGVTESGSGTDGRIKSGVGIGALVLEGIGDTIRVSLTEDPWLEAGPCRALRQVAETRGRLTERPLLPPSINPFVFNRRESRKPLSSFHADASVVIKCPDTIDPNEFAHSIVNVYLDGDKKDLLKSPDFLFFEKNVPTDPGLLKQLRQADIGVITPADDTYIFISSFDDFQMKKNKISPNSVVVYYPDKLHSSSVERTSTAKWIAHELTDKQPLLLFFSYDTMSKDVDIIRASAEFGSCFVDGIGDGMLWDIRDVKHASTDEKLTNSLNLLQASRMRTSKTEFISCPSCGRTLFDLQSTEQRIRERTGHLPGVRIAVMGCIVNGPGEMADADFGYVGSNPGKIDLYVGKKVVKKNIDSDSAVDELIDLIKEHGKWIDPK